MLDGKRERNPPRRSTATSRCESAVAGHRCLCAKTADALTESTVPSGVLIANRGEIAIRIIRACRELGIETVAVYSDADADALHVRAADRAVRIGPAPAGRELPARRRDHRRPRVETGAEAIHPGYGFLSEQAGVRRGVRRGGHRLRRARRARHCGARRQARRAATRVGGRRADRAGHVRAAAAGGAADDATRHRRGASASATRCWSRPRPAAAAGACAASTSRRAARRPWRPRRARRAAAFGDGAVYLERYVEGARHVEVQLLGDSQGTIVALGERDCSTQRRHQKLVEEAPAPGLTHEPAAARCTSWRSRSRGTVGLRNAATAEFLLTPDGDFWFLEVNARLQVEHGVTELVAGLDLVHEQLWIAAGRPLSRAVLAAAAARRGRRLGTPSRCASAPRIRRATSRPTPGTITRWREPAGPGVRVDAGVEQGSVVSAELRPAAGQADGRRRRTGTRAIARLRAGARRVGGRRHPDDAAVPSLADRASPTFSDCGELSHRPRGRGWDGRPSWSSRAAAPSAPSWPPLRRDRTAEPRTRLDARPAHGDDSDDGPGGAPASPRRRSEAVSDAPSASAIPDVAARAVQTDAGDEVSAFGPAARGEAVRQLAHRQRIDRVRRSDAAARSWSVAGASRRPSKLPRAR